MARSHRHAFTLVELLVVVVIISILVALLLPAIVGSRERARSAQCQNRLSEIAKACLTYESEKGFLPGYKNSFSAVPGLSWAAVLLPNIGRQDMWRLVRVRDFAPASGFPDPVLSGFQITELICPSDPRPGLYAALGYAVNCGIDDNIRNSNNEPIENAAYGVFFNHDANDVPVPQQIKVRTDRIPDGAQRTILASENLQAGTWMRFELEPNQNPPPEWVVKKPERLITLEPEVGLWWQASPGACGHINRCKENAPPPFPGPLPNASQLNPRPSSNHPGGVNVAFCDGHVDFITDDVDYSVYQHLMTPDSKAAGLPPEQF
ncbi:DUF1559 family PulG-like putative transporter [Thermopirellula anaerolimosa]